MDVGVFEQEIKTLLDSHAGEEAAKFVPAARTDEVEFGNAAEANSEIPAVDVSGLNAAQGRSIAAPARVCEVASIKPNKAGNDEERGQKASDELQAFIGTWCRQQDGQPTVTVTLKNLGTEITGSIIFYLHQDGKLVDRDEVQLLSPKLHWDTFLPAPGPNVLELPR
jgi:hypothetical protein